jgi:hypothetical protein
VNLAHAIRFSFQPETVTAAQNIALKMQSDSGVRAAANSFYKNLPVDNMRCHFLENQPAAWAYKKSLPKAIYLSKAAAQILGSHMRIDMKHLR